MEKFALKSPLGMYISTSHTFAYLFSDARHSRALENERTLVSQLDNITGTLDVLVSFVL